MAKTPEPFVQERHDYLLSGIGVAALMFKGLPEDFSLSRDQLFDLLVAFLRDDDALAHHYAEHPEKAE